MRMDRQREQANEPSRFVKYMMSWGLYGVCPYPTPIQNNLICLFWKFSPPPPHLQTRWACLSCLTIFSTSTPPPYETISLSCLKRESHCLSRDSGHCFRHCCPFMKTKALSKPLRKIVRQSKGGRNRIRKGMSDEKMTGRIMLTQYLSYKATDKDNLTPAYSLLMSAKPPTPNTSRKLAPTNVL